MNSRIHDLAFQAPTKKTLIEYRGSDLFGGRGQWRGVSSHQRIDEYAKLLSVLSQIKAGVAYTSIHKLGLAKKNYIDPNPHMIALRSLIERLERWIKQPHIQVDILSRRALLVADENHEQERYSIDLIKGMQSEKRYVRSLNRYKITSDHFVDGIYFDRSERNNGIQLADLVAYIINRYLTIQRYPGTEHWDTMIKQLMHNHIDGQLLT